MNEVNQIMKSKSILELCELFVATNNDKDENIPTIRGWIMDELESRDQSKFNNWIDTENVDDMYNPEKFFI